MKKYIDISGFNLQQANRGNAALSYGAIGFLTQKGMMKEGQELIKFVTFKNLFKLSRLFPRQEEFVIEDKTYKINYIPVWFVEKFLIEKWGIILPFTYFGRYVGKVEFEAADYGGDGFSDIYGDQLFIRRLSQTVLLRQANVPLLLLPMTIGPFQKKRNFEIAKDILHYASAVYVRDEQFAAELEKMGIHYEISNDLSAYMKPEKWNIEIFPNSIGLNISGLAFSNSFPNMEGMFDCYPELIYEIIKHFRNKGCHIYLIPHSYNAKLPETNNDDMVACREVYTNLKNKQHVTFLDCDLTSPRVKYVISQMSFFIGTRMHANFAAIFTNTPVFGLAYSYKFSGAFGANGLNPELQTQMITNLAHGEIKTVLAKIETCYNLLVEKQQTFFENCP